MEPASALRRAKQCRQSHAPTRGKRDLPSGWVDADFVSGLAGIRDSLKVIEQDIWGAPESTVEPCRMATCIDLASKTDTAEIQSLLGVDPEWYGGDGACRRMECLIHVLELLRGLEVQCASVGIEHS